jgi:hypothetical protein
MLSMETNKPKKDENDTTTISLRYCTRERLNVAGVRGETYDDIVNRILDERKKK